MILLHAGILLSAFVVLTQNKTEKPLDYSGETITNPRRPQETGKSSCLLRALAGGLGRRHLSGAGARACLLDTFCYGIAIGLGNSDGF
jgi:hypothetical protein